MSFTAGLRKAAPFLLPLVVVGAYVVIAGKTGFCPTCTLIMDSVSGGGQVVAVSQQDAPLPEPAPIERDERTPEDFRTVRRGVDIDVEYDLNGLTIPNDQIHTLLPRDAIPALTDPKLEALSDADWLKPDDRLLVITVNDETVAAPFRVLNWHEVANMTVGGEPVAATYCPLCDSATAISRKVITAEGETETLEFGVSGALFNSNVLMYDRTHMALWSQLGMEAVSGPMVGARLAHLPAYVVSKGELLEAIPDARTLSKETGHTRNYDHLPYVDYFADADHIMVPIAGHGDELPKKTLGVGVRLGDEAWFVPVSAIGERREIETAAGLVVLASSDAGVRVIEAPAGVDSAQTFYYSWSAFYPETQVVEE